MPSPKLEIIRTSNGLLGSWTVPSTPFVLQENDNLNTPVWTNVPATPVLNLTNLHYEFTVSSPNANRFYRLRSL